MKPNVGKLDQMLRLIAAAALAGFGAVTYAQGGKPMHYYIAFAAAAAMAITAVLRFCPAYPLLGLKTCKSCCGGGCGSKGA